jgi:hypothetical protein
MRARARALAGWSLERSACLPSVSSVCTLTRTSVPSIAKLFVGLYQRLEAERGQIAAS